MEKQRLLSVIVPCYNEEEKVYKNILKMSKIISEFYDNYEIICINDGSKDNTKKELAKASKKDKKVKIISYDKNKGKGHALKVGTEKAKGELIVFIDCDLELPPSYIKKYIAIMDKENADVVIASKMHKDSIINYPLKRKILSFCYYLLLKILFNLKVKDTQTGLKLFKKEAVKKAMEIAEIEGFSFDIEVLSIINRLGYKIVDAPIELNFTREHAMGRIKLKDITKMFGDTIKIFYKLKIKKQYDKMLEAKLGKQKNIYYFLGTEAEVMKMYNVIAESIKRGYNAIIVSNGQNIINDSPYLNLINKKVDVDLTKYAPKKKGISSYLKWFIKTRKLGIKVFKKQKLRFDFDNSIMVVHGDTMSTLMGSMIARKVKLRYVHIESGIRSLNWFSPFPEEIDRYLSSKHSILNFCQSDIATEYAEKYFKAEAINTHYNTGIEILYYALEQCKKQKLKSPYKGKYFVFAIHRQENLLNNSFMKNTINEVDNLSNKMHCIFIYHEQTKFTLEKLGLWDKIMKNKNITIIGRQDYINFINIIKHCEFIIGDGCGNQQEFFYMGKPYLIMRTKVEVKTEGLGWNALPFNNDFDNIKYFYKNYKKYTKEPIKMDEKPSIIIMNRIDKLFEEFKAKDGKKNV